MVMARKVFDTVESVLVNEYGSIDTIPNNIWFSGRLSSFDLIPEHLRKACIEQLIKQGIYNTVFAPEIAAVLSEYKTLPGRWVWENNINQANSKLKDQGVDALKHVIAEAWSGRSQVATWAKMAVTSALLSAGKLHITSEIADEWIKLLPRYPSGLNEEETKRTEAMMRSTYLTTVSMREDDVSLRSKAWAKDFWQANWKLYSCERFSPELGEHGTEDKEALQKYSANVTKEYEVLVQLFKRISQEADPDLYDPTRYEVLTGLVSRASRTVGLIIKVPLLWSSEHSSAMIRGIIETKIVLSWLILKDDPDLYKRFKAYGRGHLKLLKLHLEEYLDSQEEPSEELKSYVSEMNTLVNSDISEEFQEIELGGNFAGPTDTRKMAGEVGLDNDYKFIFAPASSTTHGEWPAVDQFALELCRNPLHKGHRLPRNDAGIVIGPQLVEFALDELRNILDRYKEGL